MTPANSLYGSNVALARYVGIDGRPPPIWGTLQHAWMPDLPFPEGEVVSRFWPILVFTERNRRLAVESGMVRDGRAIAIGDPFLYLLARASRPDVAPAATLVYPCHHRGQDEFLWAHREYAAQLLDREGGRPVTVCLHPNEHSNPNLRGAYEDAGFRVMTHGFAGSPTFLADQLTEILRHDRVVSNNVSTAVLHGGAAGREIEVYGTPFAEWPTREAFEHEHATQLARWPELCTSPLSPTGAEAFAGSELGSSCLLAPEQLRSTLGWGTLAALRNRLVRAIARPVSIETFIGTPWHGHAPA
jgi:hypothetical protein